MMGNTTNIHDLVQEFLRENNLVLTCECEDGDCRDFEPITKKEYVHRWVEYECHCGHIIQIEKVEGGADDE